MPLTTVQLGMQGTPQFYGFKNRIINGGMTIDQRNNGASVSVASGTSPYCVDRWIAYNNLTNTFTAQQSSVAPAGFSRSWLITNNASATSNAAGMYQLLGQRIEGNNIADLNWGTANAKTITVSFWVFTSQAGTYGGVVRCGAANNRFYGFSFTLAANTWTQVSTTIPGDTSGVYTTDNTNGIELLISLSCGSSFTGSAGSWSGSQILGITGQTQFNATGSATFYITGVQLEVGVTATSFDFRSIGQELALAQRYFCKSSSINVVAVNNTAFNTTGMFASGAVGGYQSGFAWGESIKFPVSMRTEAITFTFINTSLPAPGTSGQWSIFTGSWLNTTQVNVSVSTTESFTPTFVFASGTGYMYIGAWTASAEL
jgi:hypothetical protein